MDRRNFLGSFPVALAAGTSLFGVAQSSSAQAVGASQVANVLDFGAVGNGIHDDTSAVQSAFTSVASGGTVLFPPGRYLITGAISVTVAAGKALSIQGYGQDSTVLYFPTGSGIVVSFSNQFCSVHVRDMSFTTGRAGSGDTALALKQLATCDNNPALNPISDLSNVTFRGDDGYGVSDYWGTGVNVTDISNINFTSVGYFGSGASGNGVILAGVDKYGPCGGTVAYGVVYNFYGCVFESFNAGIVYGTDIQGVAIVSCNFTHGNMGVYCPAGSLNLDQLSIMSSQFGTLNNAVSIQSKLNATTIVGNLFIFAANQNCIVLNSDSSCITANVFAGGGASNNNGLFITSSVQCIVTGNSFSDSTTGVVLTQGASGVNIQSNSYRNVPTPVFNNGGLGNTIGGGSP